YASRSARVPESRDPRSRFGADGGHAPRPGSSVRALGGEFDRGDDRRTARDPSQPRRFASQPLLRRGSLAADDLGATLVSGMLAARARRAHAGDGRARRPDDYDRTILGPGRSWQRADPATLTLAFEFHREAWLCRGDPPSGTNAELFATIRMSRV